MTEEINEALEHEREKQELVAEIGEANARVADANAALGAMITALSNTRGVLKNYINYFKLAVGVGALAILMACVGFALLWEHNNDLEAQQDDIAYEGEIRSYEDCLQANQGRSNIVEVLTLIGEDSTSDPARIEAFIDLVEERLPQRDCGVKPTRP